MNVDHEKDHELFIEMNRRPFSIPVDWAFEPCPAFYDTVGILVGHGTICTNTEYVSIDAAQYLNRASAEGLSSKQARQIANEACRS
jgi:hypothetical protein